MEGFKKVPKMQCFKDGGSVKPAYAMGGRAYKNGGHSESKEMKEDVAKDKKLVKKALAMHDKQAHEGEKTDLSKLRNGGRMKKDGGCVGRYKAGGAVEMKAGKKVRVPKVRKAKTPSAATKSMGSNIKDMGPSGALDSILPPPAAGGMAAAPSASVDQMAPPPMMNKGGKACK